MNRRLIPSVGVLLVVAGLPGCGRDRPPPAPDQSGPTIHSMKWSVNLFEDETQIVTLAKYDRIQPGMTYEELTTVLGLPPDRWRPPDIDHVSSNAPVELTWSAGADQNKERSITIQLEGKTVTGKSQRGLSPP